MKKILSKKLHSATDTVSAYWVPTCSYACSCSCGGGSGYQYSEDSIEDSYYESIIKTQ